MERSRGVFGIAAVSAVVMLLLVAGSKNEAASDATFGVDNFYKGKISKAGDPKEMYRSIYGEGSRNVDNVCKVSAVKAKKPIGTQGNFTWVVDRQDLGDKKEEKAAIEQFRVSKTELDYNPFKEGDLIVAPAELVFTNANTKQSSKGIISITATMGTEYKIEFRDVKTWWCHIGKSKYTKHTETVGVGGVIKKMAAGYVIGEAKDSTTVMVYRMDKEDYKPVSLSELMVDGEAKVK